MFQVKTKCFSTSLDKEQKRAIIQQARRYIGIPWRHQGRTPTGVDCVGLLFLVVKDVTGANIEFLNYSRWPHPELLRANLKKFLIVIRKDELEPGDIVLMRSGGVVCHVGFYGDGTLIHANLFEQKVVEHRLDSQWEKSVVGCYRVPRYST